VSCCQDCHVAGAAVGKLRRYALALDFLILMLNEASSF
jgi:hypothetical protein